MSKRRTIVLENMTIHLDVTQYGVDIFKWMRDVDGGNEYYVTTLQADKRSSCAYWFEQGEEWCKRNLLLLRNMKVSTNGEDY